MVIAASVCMCMCVCVYVLRVYVLLHELVCGDWCEFLFNFVRTLRFVGQGFRVPQVKFI